MNVLIQVLTISISKGGQIKDTSGDELDGLDECLIPSDYQQKGVIIDDDWNYRLFARLPNGVHLTVVFDCCHSGSGMDLPVTVAAKAAATAPVAFGLPYAERALPNEALPTPAVVESHKQKQKAEKEAKRAAKLAKWSEKKAVKQKEREVRKKAREERKANKGGGGGGGVKSAKEDKHADKKAGKEDKKKDHDKKKEEKKKDRDEKKKDKKNDKDKKKGGKDSDSSSDSDSDDDDDKEEVKFQPLPGQPPADEAQARFIGALYKTVVSWVKPSGGSTPLVTPPLAVAVAPPPKPAPTPVAAAPAPVAVPVKTPAPVVAAPAPAPVVAAPIKTPAPVVAPAPVPASSAAPTVVAAPAATLVPTTVAEPGPSANGLPPTIVLLSGCKDEQCSADTTVAGVSFGALTNAFLDTLKSNPKITYEALLFAVRDRLAKQASIEQTPQLSYNRVSTL